MVFYLESHLHRHHLMLSTSVTQLPVQTVAPGPCPSMLINGTGTEVVGHQVANTRASKCAPDLLWLPFHVTAPQSCTCKQRKQCLDYEETRRKTRTILGFHGVIHPCAGAMPKLVSADGCQYVQHVECAVGEMAWPRA